MTRVPCPGTMTCITWGGLKKMTWAWFEKYCSEAYALVSKDWLNASGVSPSGLDLAALEKDLEAVSGQLSAGPCVAPTFRSALIEDCNIW